MDRLKRKYGKTIAEVVAFGEEVSRKLAEVEDRDEILKTLRAELADAAAAYRVAAQALTTERKDAATKLAKLAEAQINSLAMKVKFEVAVHSADDAVGKHEASGKYEASGKHEASGKYEASGKHEASGKYEASGKHEASGHDFSRAENDAKNAGALAPEGNTAHWTSSGWDIVECRIATNPGEPLKPLHEIASGGEMSRVMLALKVSVEEGQAKPNLAKSKQKAPTPRTLVFDEIDIGIGGRAAEAVGQKLKSLSRGQQILCVTHLPQIAAFADQHFLIDKRESDGRTKTKISLLDDRARTHEIARMVSGAKVTETSLQHAAQMIAASR
jgi:DNA repair protein RecN (Recombination protein N)